MSTAPVNTQGCAATPLLMYKADGFGCLALVAFFVLGVAFVKFWVAWYFVLLAGLASCLLIAGFQGRALGIGQELMGLLRGVAARISGQNIATPVQNEAHALQGPVVAWTGDSNNQAMASAEQNIVANLEQTLGAKIIAQDIAISLIVRALRRQSAGTDPDAGRRPTSFLFIGPTGTGKTELVKVVAEALGRGDLLRYDLGQMAGGGSSGDAITWTLFGSPQGYVGGEGTMTSAVAANPRAVLLLDEIEKGSPTFFDSFLSILDDGTAKDNRTDRRVSFATTLIFLTSNLVSEVPEDIYDEPDRARDYVLRTRFLRPEFLNRISYIVPFRALGDDSIRKIAAIQLEEYLKAFCKQKQCNPEMTIDRQVIDILVGATDPKYGVRDLERGLKTHIADPLTDAVILHGVQTSITRLAFVINEGKVRVEVE